MRIVFQDGGAQLHTRGELLDEYLGITGPFILSARGGLGSEALSGLISLIPHLIGSLFGSQTAESIGDSIDQVAAVGACYVEPEPDTYTLGVSPIGDGHAIGLGFPPITFYLNVPAPGPWYAPWDIHWDRIDLTTIGCRAAWAQVGGATTASTPFIAPQEVAHNLQVGPGHLSCDHGEQDLGWLSTVLNLTARVAGLFTGDVVLLVASVDLPIRCESDAQHGSIREFGLDLTSPTAWRVVDPSVGTGGHTHDFMSYGGSGSSNWISPLTYERLAEKNP